MAGVRPTGTVTFLFTDIEGSTRLWEEHPGEMETALARHDEILRSTIDGQGGYVFATGGDGFAAVFGDAPAAVRAAEEAQRRLQAHEWSEGARLRVRMGLHTGSAVERGGDYFGPAVNRAARVMSAAHGGQAIASAATRSVVGDAFAWLDLGEHRLHDLATTEDVHQLVADGLESSFPDLRTIDTLPGNLPRQITSFVGRSDEISELTSLVRAAPLVTLTGVGGVGKTRLALEVAAAAQTEFRDGAWFVELASVTDGELVPSQIATALGVHAPQTADALDHLADALRSRKLLLVLDNCEHVIGPASTVTRTLLARAPEVAVLATSREGLGLRGEQLRLVPSLPTESDATEGSAVELFLDRAREVARILGDDPETLSVVGELCQRLDGIPLAVELAAARTRAMSPAEVLARVDQRFRLLTGRDRRALERHHTLRGTIDWSYDLLTDAEATALRRLSVFVGGCDLRAAEHVLSDDALDAIDVLDLMQSLVDKSLLTVDMEHHTTRFRLLETIRQYAEEKLADDHDAAAIRQRHAEHYSSVAQELCAAMAGPGEAVAYRELLTEMPNVRNGVIWASEAGVTQPAMETVAAFAPVFVSLSPAELGLAEVALRSPGAVDHPLAPEVAGAGCWSAYVLGDVDEVNRLWGIINTRQPVPPLLRRIHAMAECVLTGDLEDMVERLEGAASDAREQGDALEYAGGRANMAFGLNMLDRHDESLPIAREAVDLAERIGCPSVTGMAYYNLAEALEHHDVAASVAAYDEAIHHGEQAGAQIIVGNALGNRGALLARQGDLIGGARSVIDGLEIFRSCGDVTNLAYCIVHGAVVLGHAKDDSALELSQATTSIADSPVAQRLRTEAAAALGVEAPEPLPPDDDPAGTITEMADRAVDVLRRVVDTGTESGPATPDISRPPK